MSIRFKIHISMVSYEYMPYLFNRIIHLLRMICCYSTLIWNKYNIVSCFIYIHHRTLLISQILNRILCDIFKHYVLLQTSNQIIYKLLYIPHTTNIKTWRSIGGWLILVRDIEIMI